MEFLVKPWEHQLKALELADPLDYFAFLFEMGAGKTMTSINAWRMKVAEQKRYFRTIVFCPPAVIGNWRDEFLRHSKVPPELIVLLDDDGKKRLNLFLKHAFGQGDERQPRIFVTNYESLLLGGKNMPHPTVAKKKIYTPGPLFQAMKLWKPEALIYDEAHRLKNYAADRSKMADILANPRRPDGQIDMLNRPLVHILSGSPVLNSPMDIFHQYKILNGGKTFGDNFFVFRARFFYDKNAGMPSQRYFPDWRLRPEMKDEFTRLIYSCGMRVTKLECMDLPDELSVTIKCKMGGAQLKNYTEMKNEFVTFVRDHPASADLAITKALRLMQISSGFLPLNLTGDEEVRAQEVYQNTDKEMKLMGLLEELTPHHKVLVWSVWRENYAMIARVCEKLKVGYVELNGQSKGKPSEIVKRFQEDEDLRVFSGNPRSGGIGVNLVVAPYSIFYSRNFSLEDWGQARARNHRGGQTSKVTHYDLVCEGIDENVQNKLAEKQKMSDDILTPVKFGREVVEEMVRG